ncbi:MAG: SGNH/GDSL hydrolase family protein [Candidatus Rokubacteria bacterium]|nr:SGNH/GDSL hydrolase family protein [Candidatus Rokubacteria bacterium]
MKSEGRLTALCLIGLVFVAGTFTPLTVQASPLPTPGYVVLGESIDFGVDGDDPGGPPTGYVPAFGDYLAGVFGTPVEVHNFAEPGATTREINLEQLAPALGEVQNHLPFGVVISYGGGGNNLLNFIESPQAATCFQVPSCLARINALLNEAQQDADLLADAALEGAAGTLLASGLNDRLRAVASKYGAKVVEVFGPFVADPDGLIGADCTHPTDAGYAVILDAFIAAFVDP